MCPKCVGWCRGDIPEAKPGVLCGCLGTAGCGLGAGWVRQQDDAISRLAFLAHHLRPRTYHIAPGLRILGYLKCRSAFSMAFIPDAYWRR